MIGNAGSFFKNPIVPLAQAEALRGAAPGAAGVPRRRRRHAQALGRLADRRSAAGRAIRDGDAGVAASHALVLVNHGRATGAQLLALARRIADSVQERFGVALEPEPRIIGARLVTRSSADHGARYCARGAADARQHAAASALMAVAIRLASEHAAHLRDRVLPQPLRPDRGRCRCLRATDRGVAAHDASCRATSSAA